jgi:hypothetical protein
MLIPRKQPPSRFSKMKRIAVMAYEDPTRPEGGHATLVLSGIDHIPEPVVVELRLTRGVATDDASGIVTPEARPLAARIIPEGLELTFGPELTELPDLVVGTEVQITLRAAKARGEFLWPDITPRASPRRRSGTAARPPPLYVASQHQPQVEQAVPAGREALRSNKH